MFGTSLRGARKMIISSCSAMPLLSILLARYSGSALNPCQARQECSRSQSIALKAKVIRSSDPTFHLQCIKLSRTLEIL
eukprot:4923464-Amphidinium_carterae.1